MKYLISVIVLLCVALSSCVKDDGIDPSPGSPDNPGDDPPVVTVTDSYVYNLPVIFHVFYQDASDPTQHVSQARLAEILRNVNDLYKGYVYDKTLGFNSGSPEYSAVCANIGVNFTLATTDESGKKLSTPGVEYIKVGNNGELDAGEFMSDNSGRYARYVWDPNQYINVMMYNFTAKTGSEDVLLGISRLPYTVMGGNTIAGLDTVSVAYIDKSQLTSAYCSSINSKYINEESSRYTLPDHGMKSETYNAFDINVTIAHELGHYLGLRHTFTEERTNTGSTVVDDCFDSDYCGDTPSYDAVEYNNYVTYYTNLHANDGALNLWDLVKRTNCQGDSFYSTNIMDYSVGLGLSISPDQRERIRNVLYYSPLVPGPKKNAPTRAGVSTVPLDLPISLER